MAAHRLVRLLPQRGVLDETRVDALAEEAPLLSALSAASIQGQLATGPRAGRRVRRLLSDPIEGLRSGHKNASPDPLRPNPNLHSLYSRCLTAITTWRTGFEFPIL